MSAACWFVPWGKDTSTPGGGEWDWHSGRTWILGSDVLGLQPQLWPFPGLSLLESPLASTNLSFCFCKVGITI